MGSAQPPPEPPPREAPNEGFGKGEGGPDNIDFNDKVTAYLEALVIMIGGALIMTIIGIALVGLWQLHPLATLAIPAFFGLWHVVAVIIQATEPR